MLAGEDYGDIAQENICSLGGTLFTACDAEGTALEVSLRPFEFRTIRFVRP